MKEIIRPHENLTGMVFSELTVIQEDKETKKIKDTKKKNIYWLCQCSCGNIKSVITNKLKSGTTKSCGCLRHKKNSYNFIDLTNKKFGKLLVKEKIKEKDKNSHIKWRCLCECGTEKIIPSYLLKSGRKDCGACSKRTIEDLSISSMYSIYKHRSKSKNIEFEITKKEFENIIKLKCYYCDSNPKKIFRIIKKDQLNKFYHNGIDRVNNKIGYTTKNSVPCCTICNRAKRDWTKQDFIDSVGKIYNFSIKNKTKETSKIILTKNKYITAYGYYRHYEKAAEKRKIEFCLSTEEFYEIIIKNCFYCNSKPLQKYGKKTFSGIDRIDSSIGYLKINCVPCCKICNHIKGSMAVDEFMRMVKRIHKNTNERR